VKVGACGINNTDIWSREGAYGRESDADAVTGWQREPMHFPRIQGADIVGRVHAVGPDMDEARVGERVIVDPTLYSGQGDGLIGCGIISARPWARARSSPRFWLTSGMASCGRCWPPAMGCRISAGRSRTLAASSISVSW